MQLGITVTDRISGFTGVVTGYVQYITGCNQALVQPRAEGNSYKEPQWIDVQKLDTIGKVAVVTLNNGSTPGADRAPPKR